MKLLLLALYLSMLGQSEGTFLDTGDIPEEERWSYWGTSGPSSWARTYPNCGGTRQSPVDIRDAVSDASLTAFTLSNFSPDAHWTFTNNGLTAEMRVASNDSSVSGGGLPATYITESFHFHWASNSSLGSEHTLNGRTFPLELHMVNYRSDLSRGSSASSHEEGLAVLGVFFEISSRDNAELARLVDYLYNINETGSSWVCASFPLTRLLPVNLAHFYRYTGSQTTPGCEESVIWTVFSDTVKISERQLQQFRSLRAGPGQMLVDNVRPLQAINGRQIKRSF